MSRERNIHRKTGNTIKHMYIAIGLDANQEEMSTGLPKASPYLQTAYLVFARNLQAATRKAHKLLGYAPKIVCQIGGFSTSELGEQPQHDTNNPETAEIAELHVYDYEDTREGVVINLEGKEIESDGVAA